MILEKNILKANMYTIAIVYVIAKIKQKKMLELAICYQEVFQTAGA